MSTSSIWETSFIGNNSIDHRRDVLLAAKHLSSFQLDLASARSARDGASDTGSLTTDSKLGTVMRIVIEGGRIKTSSAPRGYKRVERFVSNVAKALNLSIDTGDSLVYIRDEDAGGESTVDWALMANTLGWNVVVNRHLDQGLLRVHAFVGNDQ